MKNILVIISVFFLGCSTAPENILDYYLLMPDFNDVFNCEIVGIQDSDETRKKCIVEGSLTDNYLEYQAPSVCGDGEREYLYLVQIEGVKYLLYNIEKGDYEKKNWGLNVFQADGNKIIKSDIDLFKESYADVNNVILEQSAASGTVANYSSSIPYYLKFSKASTDLILCVHPMFDDDTVFGIFQLVDGQYVFKMDYKAESMANN
ncbi:hypothetical protein [Persicobacter diffluens]|uniref:Lipoprotein n=1 Tax=Persicobacter diffluens TaxID=981 RepID=A0AAN5AMA9_9BACT|nr:hypothetical protein PEDI_54070 [Persicobacter diffluens]